VDFPLTPLSGTNPLISGINLPLFVPDTWRDMGSNDFQPNRRLTTRAQARNALEDTVSQVRDRLCIFDDRGEFYGLDRRVFVEPIVQALREHPKMRISIVLHDPRYLEVRGARLLEAIRSFSPRLEVHKTNSAVRAFAKGFVIADNMVVLRRPHFDAAVTVVDYAPEAVNQASNLFEELLANSEPASLAGVTGL
jgi:hypothetical protein